VEIARACVLVDQKGAVSDQAEWRLCGVVEVEGVQAS